MASRSWVVITGYNRLRNRSFRKSALSDLIYGKSMVVESSLRACSFFRQVSSYRIVRAVPHSSMWRKKCTVSAATSSCKNRMIEVMTSGGSWILMDVGFLTMGSDAVAVAASVQLLGCLGDYNCRVICLEEDAEFGRTVWSRSVGLYEKE